MVGLGNPGNRYARTRHNIGFEVAAELTKRWSLPKAKERFGGSITQGAVSAVAGARVAVICPETFMNRAGECVGPARGSLKVPLDRVIVCHDEIDLGFGEVKTKFDGGSAGHNGLKSLSDGLGGDGFWRVRAGVGRPESTDPETVSAWVLGRFSESPEQVESLVAAAADAVEGLIDEFDVEEGRDDP